jgi:hypothetical protein
MQLLDNIVASQHQPKDLLMQFAGQLMLCEIGRLLAFL